MLGTPGERGRVSRYRPMSSPAMPTIMRTRPAVWTLMPAMCAVTAYLRIAPTAMRKRLVPIVMRLALGRPGATTSTSLDGARPRRTGNGDGAPSPPLSMGAAVGRSRARAGALARRQARTDRQPAAHERPARGRAPQAPGAAGVLGR